MRIKTSAGNEYGVDWIDTPVQNKNRLLLQMQTERTLAQIVTEFDGLEWIERYDEYQGDKRYEGFNRLVMAKMESGMVIIIMERGSENA